MAAVGSSTNSPSGLALSNFRLTNRSGFGDGLNHYAHSMAWFEDNLYVGITRATMHANKLNRPRPNIKPWPVDCPEDIYQVERRTEIWRYNPRLDQWRRVFRSPMTDGRDGRPWPRYIGLRGMAVFQGASDHKPCIYVSTWTPLVTDPPDILRSEDGLTFEVAARPPFTPDVRSFRTLQPYKGRIHTSPTSSGRLNLKMLALRKTEDSVSGDATIYATDDILSGKWQVTNTEGFGDKENVTVFEMAEFNGRLYAGTVNRYGTQLWRTDGTETQPPYRWVKVLDRGAGRGSHNEAIGSLQVFEGALYVGTGVVNGGYHRRYRIGPAASEVIRVWPDDSWDLLVGASRMTDQGLKYPLSGFAPGFDNMFAGYVWRMTVHDGWLYAGTFSWAMLLPYLPRQFWPEDSLALLRHWSLEELSYRHGGCMLWRTADGIRWYPVTQNGFGNPYNWGIRNMASTPYGLFVGTANPFGPTVAQKQSGRWQYVPNPRGGLEVYLGSPDPAAQP